MQLPLQIGNFAPQKDAVDYSLRDDTVCDKICNVNAAFTPGLNTSLKIDLNEWRGHRVLAFCNEYYYPGVIRHAVDENVFIELDIEKELIKFSNVLSNRKFDVISDASPSSKQVFVHTKVCFRKPQSINLTSQDISTNSFSIGSVCRLLNKPTRFIVETSKKENYTVRRADLRLIRPPWWDELEEDFENQRSSVQGSKIEIYCF